jgi:hypothetical protein
MAWDPTVYCDIEYAKGNKVPATQQIHFPGRDGQLREITLCDEYAEKLWAAIEPFTSVGRLTNLTIPPIPKDLVVKDMLGPSSSSKVSAGKKSSQKTSQKKVDDDNPEIPVPDEPFWEIRNLGDGNVVPLHFWRTPDGAPWTTQVALKEMRKKIRVFGGDSEDKLGPMKEDVAYRWGRENIKEILGTGLW